MYRSYRLIDTYCTGTCWLGHLRGDARPLATNLATLKTSFAGSLINLLGAIDGLVTCLVSDFVEDDVRRLRMHVHEAGKNRAFELLAVTVRDCGLKKELHAPF